MTRKWRLILLVSLIGNLAIVYVGYKALDYRSNINYWLDKYLYVVDEFSGTNVYGSANQELRSDTVVWGRIVFFGTQVINDWPLDKFFPDHETINRGVTGQRVAGFLLRFRQDVIELQPEYVLIEVSSYNFRPNTCARETFDYVVSMAELARFNDIVPVLTTVIPPGQAGQDSLKNQDNFGDYMILDSLGLYNSWIKSYAMENSYRYIDFNGLLSDEDGNLKDQYSNGLMELNSEGYRLVSKALLKSIGESPMPSE